MFCQNCGTEVKSDEKFCSSCGTKTDHVEEKPKNICSHCEATLVENSKFCPSCGSNVDFNDQHTCKKCHTTLSNNEKFCPSCGQGVDQPLAQKENVVDSAPRVEVKKESPVLTIIGVILVIGIVAFGISAYKAHQEEQAAAEEAERERIAQEAWDNDMPSNTMIASAATQCWENGTVIIASQSVSPLGIVRSGRIDYEGVSAKAVQVDFTKTEQAFFAVQNKTVSALFVKKEPLSQNSWETLCNTSLK